MSRKSIFGIERRKDFQEAFENFFEDLDSVVFSSNGTKHKVFDYLNYCIRYWPHRCGATGIDNYLEAIGVDINNPMEDRELLLIMELFINLLHWAPKQDHNDNISDIMGLSFKKGDVEKESERLICNAEFFLEQCCNMRVREKVNVDFPKYYITKRNASVDAAVEAAPELADILLGYYDIRNIDDLKDKRARLDEIYIYMEESRNYYKGLVCSAISEEFFISMNSFGIRHGTKSQVKIQSRKKKEICDKLFNMAIYILQTPDVNEYKKELKALREK